MCEIDYDWQTISERRVKRTRTPHECNGCGQGIPIGSPAHFFKGKAEGEFCTGYLCQTCDFCAGEPDHTALHICSGDMHDPQDDQEATHAYVRHCLENGETPTVTGLEAALRQHAELEALEL